jgi:hypothetical protein
VGSHKSLAKVTELCLSEIQELVARSICNEINDDVFMIPITLARTPCGYSFCNLKETSIPSYRRTCTVKNEKKALPNSHR